MNRAPRKARILMLLENAGIPEDHRVVREAEALLGIGCDVTIICPTCGRQPWSEVVRGIQVYRFPQSFSPRGFLGYVWEYGYSIAMFFLLASYVWCRQGFDVIHVHTPPDMTSLVAVFFQQFGKKFVFDHHDLSPELYLARRDNEAPNLVYRVLRYFERFACQHASRLIATNTTQRNVQIERCGANPAHCYVVRNGPNEAFLQEVQPWPELHFPGKIVLGYVGIIGVQDGVDYMIRVVQELKYQHRRDDFQAVIVGHGPALADLKVLARTLRVEQQVLFTGRVSFPDVPRYIAAFDICLTPDPSNAYNDSCTTIKTLEYMALGKPTVCFRTAENEITAGDAALYADHNDVSAYANLVIRLMDNPGLRADMGTLARRRIDAGLTWERQAAQLVELYRDLLRPP